EDKIDSAYLVTADSDYKAPLEYIKNSHPQKRVYMDFVETNFSNVLARLAYKTYVIKRDRLLACQFPDTVTLPNGYKLSRPAKWK
ncbi:MAG: hypothetical protein AB1750_07675, partial [Chloroflexota bacterium]